MRRLTPAIVLSVTLVALLAGVLLTKPTPAPAGDGECTLIAFDDVGNISVWRLRCAGQEYRCFHHGNFSARIDCQPLPERP